MGDTREQVDGPRTSPEHEEDWALLRAARAGDGSAWERLWLRHRERLFRVALSVTGERESARDAVQAVFLRLVGRAAPPREGSLSAYLTTAAWREALRSRTRELRHGPLEEAEQRIAPNDAERSREREERAARALEALERLPEAQRQVLSLRLVGGLSYDEVARVLEIPVGTVRSRLFNGVAACREWLRRRGRLE